MLSLLMTHASFLLLPNEMTQKKLFLEKKLKKLYCKLK